MVHYLKHYYWVKKYFGVAYVDSIYSIDALFMESNAFEKSTNNDFASRFFVHTPSIIRQIVRIHNVLNQFLWKPFWFLKIIFQLQVGYEWEAGRYKS